MCYGGRNKLYEYLGYRRDVWLCRWICVCVKRRTWIRCGVEETTTDGSRGVVGKAARTDNQAKRGCVSSSLSVSISFIIVFDAHYSSPSTWLSCDKKKLKLRWNKIQPKTIVDDHDAIKAALKLMTYLSMLTELQRFHNVSPCLRLEMMI